MLVGLLVQEPNQTIGLVEFSLPSGFGEGDGKDVAKSGIVMFRFQSIGLGAGDGKDVAKSGIVMLGSSNG